MLASIYYKLAKSSKRFQHFNMNISTFSGSSVSFWGNKKKTPHVSHRKSTLNRNLFYNETLWKSCRQNTKNVSNIKLIKTVYSYKSKLKKQVLLFLKSVDIYKHKSQPKIINQSKDRKNENIGALVCEAWPRAETFNGLKTVVQNGFILGSKGPRPSEIN